MKPYKINGETYSSDDLHLVALENGTWDIHNSDHAVLDNVVEKLPEIGVLDL